MSDLAQLLRAGMSDTVIIAKVNAATELRFDTSDTGLKQLREIGVSTAVLRAITDRKLQLLDARPAAPSVSKTAATPTQPGALPSAAGVYYDNSGTYQALTQAVGHQASASGGDVAKETAKETGKSWLKQKVLSAIHIYGGSDPTAGMRAAAAKAYHTYDGPDAAVKTSINPRFVMVGNIAPGQQITVVKLTAEGRIRKVEFNTMGYYNGNGLDPKILTAVTIHSLGNGTSEITLSHPLEPGEYLLSFSATADYGYDFSVR